VARRARDTAVENEHLPDLRQPRVLLFLRSFIYTLCLNVLMSLNARALSFHQLAI
jgi:hypothetical protein